MSFAMDPQEVKRREYLGLTALVLGSVLSLAGLACLLYLASIGLVLIALGAGLIVAGMTILKRIPAIVPSPDDVW
jgi:hypothetical protein